jgi:protein gp37
MMTGKSNIEWTEQTWNPIVGCSIISPGCTNCYAMKMAARIEAMGNQPRYAGTTRQVNGNAIWTGKLALAPDSAVLAPLRRKKPTVYFVNSMGDLFHEDCPDEWIDRVFAVMALCPQHTFQILTKRATRMRKYMRSPDRSQIIGDEMLRLADIPSGFECVRWPFANVWLGVSTERQQEAKERIPELLSTPAAVRFISAEPLLGPIDLTSLVFPDGEYIFDATSGQSGWRDGETWEPSGCGPKLDWVIVGGESGSGARPMHPDWARSLRDQCEDSGVAFFFKQFGNWKPDEPKGSALRGGNIAWPDGTIGSGRAEDHGGPGVIMFNVGKKSAGRLLDGVEYNGMPELRP